MKNTNSQVDVIRAFAAGQALACTSLTCTVDERMVQLFWQGRCIAEYPPPPRGGQRARKVMFFWGTGFLPNDVVNRVRRELNNGVHRPSVSREADEVRGIQSWHETFPPHAAPPQTDIVSV